MLFLVLFVIYLAAVSCLLYEPQPSSLERFLEGVKGVVASELPASEGQIAPNSSSPVRASPAVPMSRAATVEVGESQGILDAPHPLPASLRGLRSYIQENKLQGQIREIVGKSYSHCKLSELKLAIAQI
jgi:hypothetical protein